jgi:carbamoylphosphate synthase large subunit
LAEQFRSTRRGRLLATDPNLADATYIESITPDWVDPVVESEK